MRETILKWLYRTFEYIVPSGLVLYSFVIKKLFDNGVSIMSKIGFVGIITIAVIFLIGVWFYKKSFRTKINKLTNELLECIDNEKKAELVAEKKKTEAKQEYFENICFVAIFIILWLLCVCIEKGAFSLRGTLFAIALSMSAGLGLDGLNKWLSNRSNNGLQKDKD